MYYYTAKLEQQVSQLLTERDQLKHQLNELRTGIIIILTILAT